ncbi:MAG: hypothetical protein QME52_05035 [Bacteroidota bacterium]|nr:hypothetical protein [Bacteroidota bacterium]
MNPPEVNIALSTNDIDAQNTLILRTKLSHISLLLRSNSGAVPIANKSYRIHLPNNCVVEGRTDENGLIEYQNIPPGDYRLDIEGGFSTVIPSTPQHITRCIMRIPEYFLFQEESYENLDQLSTDEESEEEIVLREIDQEGWEDVSNE